MLLMPLTAYAGQSVGNAVLGSYASGCGGGQTGLLLSRAAIQLTSAPNRRAMHD
jgi:hypothetical protein